MKSGILLICFYSLFVFINPSQAQKDTTKVVILSINDQHAKFDNYDRLKALVDKIKSENPYVLLFSSGDNFTGNPTVDMYKDKGFPMIDLMNQTGFNATAVGNHEFDYGQETLARRIEQADFPFLSANISIKAGGPQIIPYKIFNLDNKVNVAVIGAIQLGSNGLPDSHPGNLSGIAFSDGVEAIAQHRNLRDSANIFIAISHLGFEKDIELAGRVPELDLILGGHTHTLTKPAHTTNDVIISQAGSNVRNLGKATIFLVEGKVVKIVPEMLSITEFPIKDDHIVKKLEQYNDNKELNQVIGMNMDEMDSKDELGSMMTDAVTALKEIDIAFQNNGGIRIDFLNKGPITIKDVYKLDPFGNEIIHIRMNRSEIKSLIINAYKDAGNEIDLQVSGLKYYIITDEKGSVVDVQLIGQNGKKLRKNKLYNVGLNSYIASSYKFEHKDSGRSLYKTTAQTLIEYIISNKEVNYSGAQRAFTKIAQ